MRLPHELTWHDFQQCAMKGTPVNDFRGYLICSKDRKLDGTKWFTEYLIGVGRALKEGKAVPLAVQLGFELHRDRAKALMEKGTQPLLRPANPGGKLLSWSFTALNGYTTCPAQYAAQRFYENTIFTESEAIKWGNRVHKAMEDRLTKETALPEGMEKWEKYCAMIEKAGSAAGAQLLVEKKIVLRDDFSMTDWFAKDAWYRGALDILVLNGEKAWVGDWKTSQKAKPNSDQLKLFAAAVFLAYPQVQEVTTKYIWLTPDTVTGEIFKREQALGIWREFLSRMVNLEVAWVNENFPCRPSGLCRGWCDNTDCNHWEAKR